MRRYTTLVVLEALFAMRVTRFVDILLGFTIAFGCFATGTLAVTVGIDGYDDGFDKAGAIVLYTFSIYSSFSAISEVRDEE